MPGMSRERERWLRMLAQQLHLLRRDDAIHTPSGVIDMRQWRAWLRYNVRRRCGDIHRYPIAETALCLVAIERDGIRYGEAIRRHIGSAKSGCGGPESTAAARPGDAS